MNTRPHKRRNEIKCFKTNTVTVKVLEGENTENAKINTRTVAK